MPALPSADALSSPRLRAALLAAGGLVAVVVSVAIMRGQGFVLSDSRLVPGAALIGWVVIAVGLYGVLVGERAETSVFFRVLRIFFVVLIAFPGMFATVAFGLRRPPPPESPSMESP